MALPGTLRDNSNLFYLDLKDNQLDEEFGRRLITLLDDNYFIEDLFIAGNLFIDQATKETIREECRKNLLIKYNILPYLRTRNFSLMQTQQKPTEDETHFRNYNVEVLALKDQSFYRSDFIVKFIKMNRYDFHSLSLTRVHFDEHIKDLAVFLKTV